MKVLFLDIDGPLIPGRAAFMEGNYGKIQERRFDPVAVAMLLSILETTQAKVVISATVGSRGYDKVVELLESNNVPRTVLHKDWVTPRETFRERPDQIYSWLSRNPEVKIYAVIDDHKMEIPNMVHVSYSDGMLIEHYNQLLEILTRDSPE